MSDKNKSIKKKELDDSDDSYFASGIDKKSKKKCKKQESDDESSEEESKLKKKKYDKTFSITFGDVCENDSNHGNQKIGKLLKEGFNTKDIKNIHDVFVKEGYECKIHDLKDLLTLNEDFYNNQLSLICVD